MLCRGLLSSWGTDSLKNVRPRCWITWSVVRMILSFRVLAKLDFVSNAQAVVLAPFFVHLELLFKAGYRPQLHHDIKNGVGKEIARIKKLEGDERRAKAKDL